MACEPPPAMLRYVPVAVYTRIMCRASPSSSSSFTGRPGRLGRRGALCLALALPWVALAAGCGQKGPLFYPPDPAEKKNGKNRQEKTSAAPPAVGPHLA